MLTTTLAEAKMMELITPKKATEEMPPINIAVSHSLSLLLLSNKREAFHAKPTNEFFPAMACVRFYGKKAGGRTKNWKRPKPGGLN